MYILDTNIISALLKKNERAIAKFEEKTFSEEIPSMSGVSYYEIKRGLLAVNATRKLKDFDKICQKLQMLFLDNQEVFDKASEIHADLKKKGRPIPDADILIAATALTLKNLILVSDDSHFQWIKDLTVENWLRE